MPYRTLPVGPLQANCTVVWNDDPTRALVVDPGGDAEAILEWLAELGVRPATILITHGHFDHTGAVGALVAATSAEFVHHAVERPIIDMTPQGATVWGVRVEAVPAAHHTVADGDVIDAGGHAARVLHTPGHTPGSVCVHVPQQDVVLTGDTLFRQSIGRTDFPGGDSAQILESIRSRLYPLDPEAVVVAGHGPSTTIGHERTENPFVQA